MSRLDDLIHKLCPNGVEYQHFEDVCDVITDYTAAGSFKDIANNVKYIKLLFCKCMVTDQRLNLVA